MFTRTRSILTVLLLSLLAVWVLFLMGASLVKEGVGRATGLEVSVDSLSLGIDNRGLLLTFKDIRLTDPKSQKTEVLPQVQWPLLPAFFGSLILEVKDLKTSFEFDSERRPRNDVFETMVVELAKTPSVFSEWNLQFERSSVILNSFTGKLEVVPLQIESFTAGASTQFVVRVEDQEILCLFSDSISFGLHCTSETLSLSAVHRVLMKTPLLSATNQELLDRASPTGHLRQVSLSLSGEGKYTFQASASGVGVLASEELPSIQEGVATISLNESGGSIDIKQLEVASLEPICREKTQFQGEIHLDHSDLGHRIRVEKFNTLNPSCRLSLSGTALIGKDSLSVEDGLLQWDQSHFHLSAHSDKGKFSARVQSKFAANTLQRLAQTKHLEKLSGHILSDTHIQGQLGHGLVQLNWTIKADLKKLISSLPAPFVKREESPGNLKLQGRVNGTNVSLTAITANWQGMDLSYDSISNELKLRADKMELPQWANFTSRRESNKLLLHTLEPTGTSRFKNLKRFLFPLMPSMDIHIQSVIASGVKVGKLELESKTHNRGISIRKFQLGTEAHYIKIAQGEWDRLSDSTRVSGWAQTSNIGQTSAHFRLPKRVDESQMRIGFDLNWSGAPWQFSLAGLNGEASFRATQGEVSAAHPTVQRLLSVASKDLEGAIDGRLEFNGGRGQVRIKSGKATTQGAARVDFPIARVGFTGEGDLTQLRLKGDAFVTPLISKSLFQSIMSIFVPSVATVIEILEADEKSYFNQLKTYHFKLNSSIANPSTFKLTQQ